MTAPSGGAVAAAEGSLAVGDRGVGRIGLDYWPVAGSAGGSWGGSLFNRWPESTAAQRGLSLKVLSAPGEDGPLSTVRAEVMREGLQEAEARIFLEEALVNKKLNGDLAKRCQQVLDRRTDYYRLFHGGEYGPSFYRRLIASHDRGWQQHSADIYRMAGQVRKKLGE